MLALLLNTKHDETSVVANTQPLVNNLQALDMSANRNVSDLSVPGLCHVKFIDADILFDGDTEARRGTLSDPPCGKHAAATGVLQLDRPGALFKDTDWEQMNFVISAYCNVQGAKKMKGKTSIRDIK